MKTNTCKFIASICYVAIAIYSFTTVLDYARYGLRIPSIADILGCLLVVISFFMSFSFLSTAGFAFLTIAVLMTLPKIMNNELGLAYAVVTIIAFLSLMIASIFPKVSKMAGITSAIMLTIRFIIFATTIRVQGANLGLSASAIKNISVFLPDFPGPVLTKSYVWFVILWHILFIVGAICFCSYASIRQNMSQHCIKETDHRNENIVDELIRMKDLLDKGVITQEEFDAKKKQLLEL